jgi:hypothetical protein
MITPTKKPFGSRPLKADVLRLEDGRIGVFIAAAYQFLDDEGATQLRDKLTAVLQTPSRTDPTRNTNQDDAELIATLSAELRERDAVKTSRPVDNYQGNDP